MGAHARFSPSAANRLIHCPPSLVLGEAFQDEESPYAAEGSAGHALAEHLIKKHLKQQTRRPVSDYYSDDLIEAVDDYVSFVVSEIEAARKECPDPIFSVEQRVDVSDYVPDCFGTADMVIVKDKLLHIIDLKLGKGVPVYAEKNPQLMIYGLGILDMASAATRRRVGPERRRRPKRWKLVSVLQSKIYLQAESQGKSEAGPDGI